MINGVTLALAASVFTASASITQRFAAAPAPGELAFSPRLILYLIRRPIWFIGILCMIIGFVFQVVALRASGLGLVQPVIATELLLVFGFLALRSPRRVQRRDWVAAVAMAVGLASFLGIAHPSGGSDFATHSRWLVASVGALVGAGVFWMLARIPLRSGRPPSSSRQAALLAIAAGIGWGFVAAVIKELSGQLSGGLYAVFTNWSPYVLLVAGAGAFFLLSSAFQAGSLAASQPGLTIVDPLVASVLGVFLFNERIRHDPSDVLGEVLALLVLVAGVILLSRSRLLEGNSAERAEEAAAPGDDGSRPSLEQSRHHGRARAAARRTSDTAVEVSKDTGSSTTARQRSRRRRRYRPPDGDPPTNSVCRRTQ
jgi:drug/metabolite transporter (DMT)-like permease